jgi:CDP-diacylglycerol--serine O-phosphatidyltransferase
MHGDDEHTRRRHILRPLRPRAGGPPRLFRRGVYLLPSMFTMANLFCGYACVVHAMRGELSTAALFIGFAFVLDMLDGRIARLTGTSSEFGGELDSLADVISFGVAPALLAYRWSFGAIPRVGWLTAFFFLVCGTLRLARFNVQRHTDSRYFVGLPIPAAAGQVATLAFFAPEPVAERSHAFALVALVGLLGLLMVSTVRYRSFKGVDLRQRRSYVNVLGIVLLFLLVAVRPEISLLAAASVYTLSGPIGVAFGLLRRRGDPPPAVAAGEARS